MAEIKTDSYLKVDKKRILFWVLVISLMGIVYWTILAYNPAYGETLSNDITINKIDKIGEDKYRLSLKYCNESSNNQIGILVFSKSDSFPIPLGVNLNEKQCVKYGAIIHTESKITIKASTFQSDDLDFMIKQFEIKRKQLSDQLVLAEQQRIMKNSLNQDSEQKESLEKQIQDLKVKLKSNKDSLVTLISLK